MVKDTIWYCGKELGYYQTSMDIDEAQAILDSFRARGKEAACIHETQWGADLHHIYVEG